MPPARGRSYQPGALSPPSLSVGVWGRLQGQLGLGQVISTPGVCDEKQLSLEMPSHPPGAAL